MENNKKNRKVLIPSRNRSRDDSTSTSSISTGTSSDSCSPSKNNSRSPSSSPTKRCTDHSLLSTSKSVNRKEITYTSDYNIVALDAVIRAELNPDESMIEYYHQELVRIKAFISEACSIVELRELETKQLEIQKKLRDLEDCTLLKKYIKDTEHFILAYRDTPRKKKIIDITNSDHERLTDSEKKIEALVDNYFHAASKCVPLKVKKEAIMYINDSCVFCGSSLQDRKITLAGTRICGNSLCKSESSVFVATNVVSKEYDTWNNLLKAHRRYTGITPVKFDIDIMMKELDAHFVGEGKKEGAYYRALPLTKKGFKTGTSHEELCTALKKIGYQDYFKDYRYIAHKYYGWILPNLTHLEDIMASNFRAKQEVWNRLRPDQRGGYSSLATQFRLCMEYQHAGYDCDLEDFRVSKKISTIARYYAVYSTMCREAGFEFPHSV